ncbi:MAG: DUF3095 domain-containing protein [Paracoccaceae bacterium]
MSDGFYSSLAPNPDFTALSSGASFTPLPDDWSVCVTDIVNSTAQVTDGRYKAVNMVGASIIATVMNAVQGEPFPYVFSGDGASFAVSPRHADRIHNELALLRRWVESEFDMQLRAAMLSIADIRSARRDVRVARYAPSDGVDYAMFAGGGVAWAETRMKAGAIEILPAETLGMPDLTGLSCRWSNVKARNGTILSLVILPLGDEGGFARIADQIIRISQRLNRGGHPVPSIGPNLQYPPPGLALEAHTMSNRMPFVLRKLLLRFRTLFSYSLFRFRIRLGRFDPVHYRAAIHRNADYRKYDDGLKMTLDCDATTRDRILSLLHQAQKDGIVRYGHHEQDEAMVTCIVPSAVREDHVHFVDGAGGGYTAAAARMKNRAV